MTINTLEVDIRRIAEKSKRTLETAMQAVIQDISKEVVLATPGPGNTVRVNPPPGEPTGNLRAHWYSAFNSPDEQGPENPQPDKSGAATIARINAGVQGAEIGEVVYILNNAAYAARLEFGFVGEDSLGRQYNQPPRAFVRGTVNRASAIAERTIQRIAKR